MKLSESHQTFISFKAHRTCRLMGRSVEGSKPALNPGRTCRGNTGVTEYHRDPGDSTLNARLQPSAAKANHSHWWGRRVSQQALVGRQEATLDGSPGQDTHCSLTPTGRLEPHVQLWALPSIEAPHKALSGTQTHNLFALRLFFDLYFSVYLTL